MDSQNTINISMDFETGEFTIHTEEGYNKVIDIVTQKSAERASIKDDEPRRFTISTEIGRLKRAADKWREDNPIPVIKFNEMVEVTDFLRMVWGCEGEIAAANKYPDIAERYNTIHSNYLKLLDSFNNKFPKAQHPGNWSLYFLHHFMVPMFDDVLDIPESRRFVPKDNK